MSNIYNLLLSIDFWGEKMAYHLYKLRQVLLESIYHSVRTSIKSIGHLKQCEKINIYQLISVVHIRTVVLIICSTVLTQAYPTVISFLEAT